MMEDVEAITTANLAVNMAGNFKAMITALENDVRARQALIVKLEEAQARLEEAITGLPPTIAVSGNGAEPEPALKTWPPEGTTAKAAPKPVQSSAAFLAGFDRRKVRTLAEVRQATGQQGRNIGVLIRHGYLTKKGDGYLRTARTLQ